MRHSQELHPAGDPFQQSSSDNASFRLRKSHGVPTTHSHNMDDKWDEQSHRQRWSIWTADTAVQSNDDSREEEALAVAQYKSAYSQSSKDQSATGVDTLSSVEDHELSDSAFSSPPSPTSEAALDAALSSTMLALTTANSLLLSTMASRREMARMRALESALESELDKRESQIKRQIDSTNMTTQWIENASRRLDDLLAGRTPESITTNEELEQITALVESRFPSKPNPHSFIRSQGNVDMPHERIPSTGHIVNNERSNVLGIVEARDESATIGKSAAKRLEKMLKHASQPSSSSDHKDSKLGPPSDHRSRSDMPKGNTLQPRLSASAKAESVTATASPALVRSSRTSLQPSMAHSLRSADHGAEGIPSTGGVSTASLLLNAALGESSPSTDNPSTPPSTLRDLPDENIITPNHTHEATSSLAKRVSLSHLRSPSALLFAGQSKGSGSSLSNIHPDHLDPRSSHHPSSKDSHSVRNKGALEALRRLNSSGEPSNGAQVSQGGAHDRNSSSWGGYVCFLDGSSRRCKRYDGSRGSL